MTSAPEGGWGTPKADESTDKLCECASDIEGGGPDGQNICGHHMYRDEIYSLQNLLSMTQAGPGRTVKQEQEENSPNHVQRLNLNSVQGP